MRQLRKIYFRLFKKYNVLELRFVSYSEGDKLIRESNDKPEAEKWVLADEEDNNRIYGMVYLCRKIRITE